MPSDLPSPNSPRPALSLPDAVARLDARTPVASRLTSAQWQELSIGLRDRAFFSARVEDLRTVVSMQGRIRDALTATRRDGGAFMSRARFISDMRAQLGAAPGNSGELTDLTSDRRLGLIYDFNTEDAIEYGRWLARQDPDILDMFPCSELVRIESREVPRGFRRQGKTGALVAVPEESWPAIWAKAGGIFVGDGRMIAPKDSPIWVAISQFGRPWGPFAFGSGMGLADVSRRDSEQLGVITPGAPAPAPQKEDFNENLQASVPDAEPATLEAFQDIFGEQVDVDRAGKITWQGQRVAKLYSQALTDRQSKWSLDLGAATPRVVAQARQLGVDLAAARLHLTADQVRHIDLRHGAGEPRLDQRPITSLDVQLIPHVWRSPDSIEAEGDVLIFRALLDGLLTMVGYARNPASGRWEPKTFYVKKEKGTP